MRLAGAGPTRNRRAKGIKISALAFHVMHVSPEFPCASTYVCLCMYVFVCACVRMRIC